MVKVHEEVVNDLQKLLTLVEIERRDEFVFFSEHLARLSIQQKVKEGFTWFPVRIMETGYGLGDYPYIQIESKHPVGSHQFNAGKQVRVYNSSDEREFLMGSVYYVDGVSMKIVFMLDELPEWLEHSKLGVDITFDDKTFKEMELAIKVVMNAKNCRLAELANCLYGHSPARRVTGVEYYQNADLNESQNRAVNAIIGSEDVAFIHGPPGTGKTTTLVAAIHHLVKNGEQVLVTAPSNAAADHLVVELGLKGMKVVRIGNVSRIANDLLSYTVEGLLGSHSRQKELSEYKWRALEYRRMAAKYKRNFGPEERRQRDLLYKEARSLSHEARMLEDYLVQDILKMSQVVVTTLVGVESKYLENMRFNTVVIDEAAQALEPACWIPVLRANRVVMAGDPFQLPPTVKSTEAAKGGLGITLMEKGMKCQPDAAFLLEVQYRMNEHIMQFSNQEFYYGKLTAHPSVASRVLKVAGIDQTPVVFIDTAGCGFEEMQDEESLSLYNEGEIKVLLEHLKRMETLLIQENKIGVAIISPYRQQVRKLEEEIVKTGIGLGQVKINTVDSFQGQERDIVYISLVRSNNNGDIGFLKDYRRMNVALTRAKKMLVVVGDSATLCNDGFYNRFLEFVEQNGAYLSAWDYLYNEY